MSFNISNIPVNLAKLDFKVKKNSPIIMTCLGIAGLCGTGILAYKAHGKVKGIVEDVEDARAHGDEVSSAMVVARVGLAVTPTIVVGGLSILSILGSYHVLTNRNNVLASALAAVSAENSFIKKRILEKYPEANFGNVDGEEEISVKDAETGKKKKVVVVEPNDVPSMAGIWYHNSSSYVRDDHNYNQTYIATRIKMLDNKLQKMGFLTWNDLLSALDMPTHKNGALLGWTSDQFFDVVQTTVQVQDPEDPGYTYPDIWLEWPTLKAIYNNVNYSSDLSDYWYN